MTCFVLGQKQFFQNLGRVKHIIYIYIYLPLGSHLIRILLWFDFLQVSQLVCIFTQNNPSLRCSGDGDLCVHRGLLDVWNWQGNHRSVCFFFCIEHVEAVDFGLCWRCIFSWGGLILTPPHPLKLLCSVHLYLR